MFNDLPQAPSLLIFCNLQKSFKHIPDCGAQGGTAIKNRIDAAGIIIIDAGCQPQGAFGFAALSFFAVPTPASSMSCPSGAS